MISFVYFDLGGVVEKDFSASNKLLDLQKELGISESYEQAFRDFWREYDREICTILHVETLLPILKKRFAAIIPEDYSLLHAFVKRFEKNNSIWPVVEMIKLSTKVGLLTNMYPGMFNAIQQAEILPPISWDVVIDSSVVGYKKPDKEIFEIAEKEARSVGSNILFVDNSLEHTQAAKEFGWQTFFYDSKDYEKSSNDLADFWNRVKKN